MERIIYDNQKYVEIWLTRTEAEDEILRESLRSIYEEYKSKKYRVVVFESGNDSLIENTKDLLRHAIEVEAQNDISLSM